MLMTKVVFVPLDERPCNYKFPQMLAAMTDLNLVVPKKAMLGKKKIPAKYDDLKDWLLEETVEAKYLIISIDMLLYGGIVPSRLHHLSTRDCKSRINILSIIKQKNPEIKIFAFNLIMRTPSYNNNDEEPDYYEKYGERIFTYGWTNDKYEKGDIKDHEIERLQEIKSEIPNAVLADFLQRRKVNQQMNIQTIDFVKEGIIDHLVIPLDDNSTYGFTSSEQKILTLKIEKLNLIDQVFIYPGADEVGCTLLANVFTEVKGYYPEVFVRYSSTNGPFITPRLEDRSLNESIKSQLTAVNAFMADNSSEADCVLMVNSSAIGGEFMADGKHEGKHHTYYSEVNYREFVNAITMYQKKDKMIALADVSVINGGDHQLLKILAKRGLLDSLDAYAGWNTVGNSMGTVIAHAVIYSYYKKNVSNQSIASRESKKFYMYRLIEDWGFQSIVRQYITDNELSSLGASYFDIKDVMPEVQKITREKLMEFSHDYLASFSNYNITEVDFPWKRMFEINFELEERNSTIK